MAEAMADVLAIPDKRAAKLARISVRQLRYWEQTGLIVPSIKRQISQRNTVQRYLQAGYGTDTIIEEYPSLTPGDVEVARRYTAV